MNQPFACVAERPAAPASPVAVTLADALVDVFTQIGVRHAFGVSGGGIAVLWAALTRSPIRVCHFRHEAGAAFAATEAHFASGAPVVVFTTAGPGLTNALTGLLAARSDGAKVILVSACTSEEKRGRWAIQETSRATMPAQLYEAGALFHMATIIESAADLPGIARALADGVARPGGFVAHIALPTGLQASRCDKPPRLHASSRVRDESAQLAADVAPLLAATPFAIWLGFGARGAAAAVRALAEHTGAPVFCSPRGKGIFPEDHAQFVGVTGIGGHDAPAHFMRTHKPGRVLVLGTRLGEGTSFWDPAMVPAQGFIHVDIDPAVPGSAYPNAPTLAICADIDTFAKALLERMPSRRPQASRDQWPHPSLADDGEQHAGRVRPEALMAAIQRGVIDKHDALVLAESGNSFAWATHHLQFREPGRYRVSTRCGAMGHCAAGVVGSALATGRKAVAIVGDGAMLMNNEINTAVQFGARAVWIVLNDARYNMCHQGMAALGMSADASIPKVDFALMARAMGASGVRVSCEAELAPALAAAMTATGPYLIDVDIDPDRVAPTLARNRGLRAEGTA